MENRTRIYERRGATTVWLDASFTADGSLLIEGFDCGDAPREAYGRDDLEYELRVPGAAVHAALLALLQKLLAESGTPITDLRQCLDAAKVSNRFRIIP